MKKSHKVPLIVLSIISALLLLAAAGFYFLLPTLSGGDIDGQTFFQTSFGLFTESFVAAFKGTNIDTMLHEYASAGAEKFCRILGIIQLVFSGIFAFLFLFGFIYVLCKKRPGSLAIQFLLLLAGVVGAWFIACGPDLLQLFTVE